MNRTPPGAFPLYGPEFAQDPQGAYAEMRARHGAVAPVEIAPGVPAHLVIGYWACRDLLQDTGTWSKDPRAWQETVPADSPVLGMLMWRPNPLFTDDETHARYRRVVTDCFARLEPHALRALTQDLCTTLITSFAAAGRADLVNQYARLVPLYLFNRLFGLADDAAPRLVSALAGLMESRADTAAAATAEFEGYMTDLYGAKLARRGADLTSWFIDHPERLSAEEIVHHLILTVGAGQEPTTNLISNALSRMLSDERYYATWSDGALTPRDAIAEVLRHEPPMANYAAHYPRWDVHFHGAEIPAHSLTLVSFAAANLDPAGLGDSGRLGDGGAHLAWSAGPHTCPVRQPATQIALTAVEQLTTRCTGLELAVPRERLEWRLGPFHRALAHLPVTFTPVRPAKSGDLEWIAPTALPTRSS